MLEMQWVRCLEISHVGGTCRERERRERERERERARVMSCKGKLFSIYDDAYVYIYIHEQPSKRAITNLVKSGREFQELG